MLIPPTLDRFIDLMTQLSATMDEFKDAHQLGATAEAFASLGRLRSTASKARLLLPELAQLGASLEAGVRPLDARLQAVDLSIDRYLSLAADGRVEASASSTIGEHIAFVVEVAEALRRKRDESYKSGRLKRPEDY